MNVAPLSLPCCCCDCPPAGRGVVSRALKSELRMGVAEDHPPASPILCAWMCAWGDTERVRERQIKACRLLLFCCLCSAVCCEE